MRKIFLCIIVFALSFALANADVKLEFENVSSKENKNVKKVEKNTMILSPTKIKMDTESDEGLITMLYNSEKEKMTIINHSEKNYFVLNKEKVDNLSKQINAAMQQMEEQLANMPEAQKKMMENMMKKQMGGLMDPPEYDLINTNETKIINSWNTTKHNMTKDGEVTDELWVTSFSDIGVSESEYSIMKKFSEFFEKLLKSIPGFSQDPYNMVFKKLEGIPVRSVSLENNTETTLISVNDYTITDSDMQIPGGYKEQDINTPNMTR